MKNIFHRIVFLSMLLLHAHVLFASHIIGGEMSYVCLGNDQYQITLKVFRDCYNGQAPYDDPTYITIYDGNNNQVAGSPFPISFPGSDTLENNTNNSCLIMPPGICVEEADFVTTVTLPASAGGYTMVYQRCCRNMIIFNIVLPDNTGASYVATIPDSSLAECNSSPYFQNFPPTVICVDQPFSFDHSAIDPDGDSLVYQLCTPYNGGQYGNVYPVPADPPPYTFVSYNVPYSASDPLGGYPPLQIDPQTGILTGTPNTTGNFVVGICCYEYRNGIFLAEHKRDFQFNVVQCSVSLSVLFTGPDGLVNQPIQFTDMSTTDSGYISSWSWDFGDGGTSTLQNPTHPYQTTGNFVVTLIVTTSAGCVGQYILTVHVDYGVGIASQELPDFSHVVIYNMYGQQQAFRMIQSETNGLITTDTGIPSGIYFFQYQNPGAIVVKKVFLQH